LSIVDQPSHVTNSTVNIDVEASTVNTTIYPKGYAQSKCVSYIVTMRAGDG